MRWCATNLSRPDCSGYSREGDSGFPLSSSCEADTNIKWAALALPIARPHVFRRADRVLVQAEPLAAEILEQFDRPGLRPNPQSAARSNRGSSRMEWSCRRVARTRAKRSCMSDG